MPKISVIMSVYNCDKYVREAILSILDQSFSDFEFIIINDGSTDKSREIIESIKDERVILINNQNKGLTKSLNEAVKLSKGEFIARMDADDISLKDRFEKQINFLNLNLDISMCGAWADFIDADENFLKTYKRPITDKEIKKKIIFHNPFIHSTVMIRKEIFSKVGLYNESFRFAQDYELWTRVVSKFKTANLSEVLLKYRVLNESITKSKNLKVRLLGIKIRLLGIWRILFA
jgi:glycosyltransferase involved in cell wall biosynthesis